MLYVLYGISNQKIKQKIDAIKQEQKIDLMNVNKYDYLEDSLSSILEDAKTYSLFAEWKMIIINHMTLFTGSNKKEITEEELKQFEAYITSPNEQTIMVFVVQSERLDERKKIVKLVKKHAQVCSLENEQANAMIKRELKNFQISSSTIQTMIDIVGENPDLLQNEINKLILYKKGDFAITTEDIEAVCSKDPDYDIFIFIDSIIQKEKQKAISIYEQLMKAGEEPIKIIVMLANQFRLMYQAKELLNKGFGEKDIATHLNVHPYRIKLALEKARKYQSNTLKEILLKLADLDATIKSGSEAKYVALELFILEL